MTKKQPLTVLSCRGRGSKCFVFEVQKIWSVCFKSLTVRKLGEETVPEEIQGNISGSA